MRKIFLDVGAHRATSLAHFMRNWPDHPEYEIHSFEANEDFIPFFANAPSNVTVHNIAVSQRDGFAAFYVNGAGSSTLIEAKAQRGNFHQNIVLVRSLNFSKWMAENIKPEDYVIAKFDIEGEEFSVLRKMLIDGTINLVDELFCEFHWHKTGGQVTPQEHITLVEDLLKIGLVPKGWAAQDVDAAPVAFHKKLGYDGNEHRSLELWPELYVRSAKCIEIGIEMMKNVGRIKL